MNEIPNLLIQKQIALPNEFVEVKDVQTVVTKKGSRYRYLSDGRSQRFKTVENKEYEPQDALVYVPSYEWVQKNAPAEVLTLLGENEGQYEQTLLEYIQDPKKDSHLTDQDGIKVETNEEIRTKKLVYLALGQNDNADIAIPVSSKPTVGFYTYDSRKYKDEKTGQMMRERHLGNKIIEIIKK